MPFDITCPTCGFSAQVPDSFRGKAVTCPKCRKSFRAPSAQVISPPSSSEIKDVLPVEGAGNLSSTEETKLARQGQEAPRRVVATGFDGEVELLRNSVVIRRRGFVGFALHGGIGDKEIPLWFISGIEFQDVGVNVSGIDFLANLAKNRAGYIRFLHPGSTQVNQGGLSFTGRARGQLHDENRVSFSGSSREAFLALKEAVMERINELHSQ